MNEEQVDKLLHSLRLLNLSLASLAVAQLDHEGAKAFAKAYEETANDTK